MSQLIGSLQCASQSAGPSGSKAVTKSFLNRVTLVCLLAVVLLLTSLSVHGSDDGFEHFIPAALAISRIQHDQDH